MSECEHREFEAHVEVNRLEDVKRFAADIHIKCAECGEPFRFLGLSGGLNLDHPTSSVDGTEARLPIAPSLEPVPDNPVPSFKIKYSGSTASGYDGNIMDFFHNQGYAGI